MPNPKITPETWDAAWAAYLDWSGQDRSTRCSQEELIHPFGFSVQRFHELRNKYGLPSDTEMRKGRRPVAAVGPAATQDAKAAMDVYIDRLVELTFRVKTLEALLTEHGIPLP
jgi:hypothetical protein